jgi:hypothetical protein
MPRLNIDPNLVEDDLRAKISYIALVQRKEQSQPIPACTNDRHYGLRVQLSGAPGSIDKHVFLHWNCDDKRLGIINVAGKTRETELYEVKPGFGKTVNRDVNIIRLRDAVLSANRGYDCWAVAEAMYLAATGSAEVISVSTETDDGAARNAVRLSDVEITTLVEELNSMSQEEAERIVAGRRGLDTII